ncbi:MAG: 30S ribosomal protein S16 [Chloroflexota bacterium]
MVRIRLRRVGARKRPAYRIVVANSRAPRSGAVVEVIGLYDPICDPPTINIDEEKARHWLRNGAQPSDSVARLFTKVGILERQQEAAKEPPVSETPPAPKKARAKRSAAAT